MRAKAQGLNLDDATVSNELNISRFEKSRFGPSSELLSNSKPSNLLALWKTTTSRVKTNV